MLISEVHYFTRLTRLVFWALIVRSSEKKCPHIGRTFRPLVPENSGPSDQGGSQSKFTSPDFCSWLGFPPSWRSIYSVKPGRPNRLYTATDRQTEFQCRPCRSIDHTDLSTHQAVKAVINGYAIRLSHDRAVHPKGGGGYVCVSALSHSKNSNLLKYTPTWSFFTEPHPSVRCSLVNYRSKKKKRGKEEEKKKRCYPIIGGFNQSVNFGIFSIKL